jgi:hypothetical protein
MEAGVGIALGGIVLSIFTVYFNHLNGKDAREEARSLARETRDAQATEARRARLHDARKAVYEEVLEYVLRTQDMVNRTERRFTFEGEPGPPELPMGDELRKLNARIGLHASGEMREKLTELDGAVEAFQVAVFELRDALQSGSELVGLRANIDATRAAVKPLVADVIDVANRELAE